jgi:hypothetical protein
LPPQQDVAGSTGPFSRLKAPLFHFPENGKYA